MHRESKGGGTILVKLHTFASLDLRLPPRVASPPMPEQSRARHSVVIATWEAGVSLHTNVYSVKYGHVGSPPNPHPVLLAG